jgi:riboflavin kinase / FMN adenylyltransferase
MKVLAAATDLSADSRPVCAAIGVFDGVHLGHQQVLRQTVSDAARCGAVPLAVTFDRHPNAIVAPANVPPLIYPLSKKLEVLAALGLEAAYVIRFDKPFSGISGEQFIRGLARDFRQVETICVGDTFMFGSKRSGNVALLQKLGAELRFEVRAMRDVTWEGQPVSSTRVREAVRAGDFNAAAAMLGRPYSLRGPVIQGERVGRKLGFPTANVDVTGILVPPSGVYVAEAQIGAHRCRAAVNIGHRPTMQSPAPQLQVEAHLLDFDRDIYSQDLELTFLKKLRDEQKFSSIDALRAQIAIDVAQARDFRKT